MTERMYRFTCDGRGIYEAVERDCPRDDLRRNGKPDGGWLMRVGKDYPGAISFWKAAGLKKYESSGLRDWHLSVVSGDTRLVIAERGGKVLYEDELQVICAPDEAKVLRDYKVAYQGPRPFVANQSHHRPECIRHHHDVRDWCEYSAYRQSEETFSCYSPVAAKLGLERIAVNHEVLRPGQRTSWPHAHKVEEEMVFVLGGTPDVWINGYLFRAKPGDLFHFPFDSGLAHTVINDTDQSVDLLVFGEQDKEEDWVYYPMHPERNQECKDLGALWEDHPGLPLGPHSGSPGDSTPTTYSAAEAGFDIAKLRMNVSDVEPEAIGSEADEDSVYFHDRELARKLGTKRIAFHHITLPSGYRTSLPHAESHEEEFVYVLKGRPIAWINGHRHPLEEGDGVSFPAGTGVLHTFLNESGEDVELMVSGERTKEENLCAFPLNPEQKETCGIWWEDPPAQELGEDSPFPS